MSEQKYKVQRSNLANVRKQINRFLSDIDDRLGARSGDNGKLDGGNALTIYNEQTPGIDCGGSAGGDGPDPFLTNVTAYGVEGAEVTAWALDYVGKTMTTIARTSFSSTDFNSNRGQVYQPAPNRLLVQAGQGNEMALLDYDGTNFRTLWIESVTFDGSSGNNIQGISRLETHPNQAVLGGVWAGGDDVGNQPYNDFGLIGTSATDVIFMDNPDYLYEFNSTDTPRYGDILLAVNTDSNSQDASAARFDGTTWDFSAVTQLSPRWVENSFIADRRGLRFWVKTTGADVFREYSIDPVTLDISSQNSQASNPDYELGFYSNGRLVFLTSTGYDIVEPSDFSLVASYTFAELGIQYTTQPNAFTPDPYSEGWALSQPSSASGARATVIRVVPNNDLNTLEAFESDPASAGGGGWPTSSDGQYGFSANMVEEQETPPEPTLLLDEFNDTNGTLIQSHTPDIISQGVTVQSGVGNLAQASINSGKLTRTSAGGNAQAGVIYGFSDPSIATNCRVTFTGLLSPQARYIHIGTDENLDSGIVFGWGNIGCSIRQNTTSGTFIDSTTWSKLTEAVNVVATIENGVATMDFNNGEVILSGAAAPSGSSIAVTILSLSAGIEIADSILIEGLS